mmetsp:Transcript_17743/g.31021  ORF Transcript_17743/g.31021 Transcript_17743/m.31021 type:complete len:85 (+) Transcript_17743:279-533(+)
MKGSRRRGQLARNPQGARNLETKTKSSRDIMSKRADTTSGFAIEQSWLSKDSSPCVLAYFAFTRWCPLDILLLVFHRSTKEREK